MTHRYVPVRVVRHAEVEILVAVPADVDPDRDSLIVKAMDVSDVMDRLERNERLEVHPPAFYEHDTADWGEVWELDTDGALVGVFDTDEWGHQ